MCSRNPGESAEQWNARASAEYHAAWDALGVERRRFKTTNANDVCPVTEAGYDDAIDRLMAADCERGDAAIAADREHQDGNRDDGRRNHLDDRMTGEPLADSLRRPGYDDSRHGSDPSIDWARFRHVVAIWDAAQSQPRAVQDPFSNLPTSD